jgi:hypothetical protein
MIEGGGAMQPLDFRPASMKSAPLAMQSEPAMAKSAGTEPAVSMTKTAISTGGRTTEIHDPTLIKPQRTPPIAEAGKPPILLFAGIGLLVVAMLIGGGVWFMNQNEVTTESSADAGSGTIVAMNAMPDAMTVAEVVTPGDGGSLELLDAGDATDDAGELAVDAGSHDPVDPNDGDSKSKSKSKSKNKSKNKTKTKTIMTERGEGVITGPATMTIDTGNEDGESLTAIAKKCTSSVLKGRAKLTLKKCPDGCVVIVDEKCGGKTPAAELALPNGHHSVAVVCGSKIVMETRSPFPPEEVTELTCR